VQALSAQAEGIIADGVVGGESAREQSNADDVVSRAIVAAMRSGIGSFDERGFVNDQNHK
jgi:hypothetical protein